MKNALTLDGRLHLPAGVTAAKLRDMRELVEATKRGNRQAAGRLVEAMTTSDAVFNFAHLVNLNVLPQFDEAPRTWTQIATRRPLSDFRPAVLYSLVPDWQDGVLGSGTPRHISPLVPEGVPYPYATLRGEEYEGNGIVKRGFKVGLTWEALVNDAVGFVNALPSEILKVALDTEEYEVYNALISGVGSSQQVAAGTAPITGATVTANPKLTRDALLLALQQFAARTINGRRIVNTAGWNLIVPVGTAPVVNFLLNQTLNQIQTNPASGTPEFVYAVNGTNPLAGITPLESEYVTGDAWYLVPKPGGFRRPVLELGTLIGNEAPELRVNNATGSYVGGGAISPYEGSFDNDSVDFRVRQVIKGLNWTPDAIIWSNGSQS